MWEAGCGMWDVGYGMCDMGCGMSTPLTPFVSTHAYPTWDIHGTNRYTDSLDKIMVIRPVWCLVLAFERLSVSNYM